MVIVENKSIDNKNKLKVYNNKLIIAILLKNEKITVNTHQVAHGVLRTRLVAPYKFSN